jgi:hypothetical protein
MAEVAHKGYLASLTPNLYFFGLDASTPGPKGHVRVSFINIGQHRVRLLRVKASAGAPRETFEKECGDWVAPNERVLVDMDTAPGPDRVRVDVEDIAGQGHEIFAATFKQTLGLRA